MESRKELKKQISQQKGTINWQKNRICHKDAEIRFLKYKLIKIKDIIEKTL